MKSTTISSLCLAVVALSTGTSAEKEAAQTFGYIGDPTDYGYGYGHGAGVGAGLELELESLGLELVLDSKAPVMVMTKAKEVPLECLTPQK
ncbi:hypothetical protein Plhal710r2_c006g0028491 [Plasmopara halstedii]